MQPHRPCERHPQHHTPAARRRMSPEPRPGRRRQQPQQPQRPGAWMWPVLCAPRARCPAEATGCDVPAAALRCLLPGRHQMPAVLEPLSAQVARQGETCLPQVCRPARSGGSQRAARCDATAVATELLIRRRGGPQPLAAGRSSGPLVVAVPQACPLLAGGTAPPPGARLHAPALSSAHGQPAAGRRGWTRRPGGPWAQ